ncbi:TPA: TIGR02391 family protein, partial [Streptococcus pyogenes]|nr:TIGR02391 family protein [Streptococcus pyogenes]
MRPIDNQCVETISKYLGEIVTGSVITKIFAKYNWVDHDTSYGEKLISTKWKRIYTSLIEEMNKAKSPKPFFTMIEEIMDPLNFINEQENWDQNRNNINFSLSFYGYELTDGGKIKSVKAAKTFSEAVSRSKNLLEKLENHNIHHDVLKYCSPELLDENYFHAIFE